MRTAVKATVDLLDVNVWLTLSLPDHPHHSRALAYWHDESVAELAFCRVTALAFVRLCTNSTVMGGDPLSVARAWALYRSYCDLPHVVFAAEPRNCEIQLGAWAGEERFGQRLWTDAFLAAFALAGGFRLVTFDGDFSAFPELNLLHLKV